MSEKEILLEVISGLAEDLIGEATDGRIALSNRTRGTTGNRRKRCMMLGGIAAGFVLICTVVALVLILGGGPGPAVDPGTDSVIGSAPDAWQVPVYRGMSVSGEVSEQTVAVAARPSFDSLSAPRAAVAHRATVVPLAKNDLQVEGTDSAIYYTKPNEDIYITIHIDNPKQYEILSFTLNGVKYQSYMIEPESTSEQLILKVNVGDVEGLVEYTIDAIKYVDGKKIEDVRMEGDKTVKVGVYTEESQPKAAFANEALDDFSMSWDITVTDELDLVGISKGEVYAVLCEEFGEELARQKLDMSGTIAFSCDGLVAGKAYKRQIVAYYDSLDGQGFAEHVIAEQIICTKGYVTFSAIGTTKKKDAVTFDLDIPTDKKVSIEKIELITDGGAVAQAGDASVREFSRKLPGRYKVVVAYTYDLGDGQGTRQGFAESGYYELEMNILQVMNNGNMMQRQSMHVNDPTEATEFGYHQGVDIIARQETAVYALFGGTVEVVAGDGDAGDPITVVIRSSDGKYKLGYFLLEEVYVKEGQTLCGGEMIGKVGFFRSVYSSLCNLSDSTHPYVHVNLFMDDKMVDPVTFREVDYSDPYT